MKTIFRPLTAAAVAVVLFASCKKDINDQQASRPTEHISQEVLGKIKALGFGTSTVQKVDDGYLVEGDILLTKEHLDSKPHTEFIRVGDEEQYRTSNTVLGLPRTITVRVNAAIPAIFVAAVDAAIARYNALYNPGNPAGTSIRFQRVAIGGQIVINPAPAGAGYLASAGFPTDAGNPYNQVLVNIPALNAWAANTKTTVIAHELGHCIGFRHTDYANRSFSCGGAAVNEGAGINGAKHIPGTPVGPDPNSWMLACIGNGVNRPFNNNDVTALRWLY